MNLTIIGAQPSYDSFSPVHKDTVQLGLCLSNIRFVSKVWFILSRSLIRLESVYKNFSQPWSRILQNNDGTHFATPQYNTVLCAQQLPTKVINIYNIQLKIKIFCLLYCIPFEGGLFYTLNENTILYTCNHLCSCIRHQFILFKGSHM